MRVKEILSYVLIVAAIVAVSYGEYYYLSSPKTKVEQIEVKDYYKGKIHYLIIVKGNGVAIINYTQDSTMVEENSKYLDK